jgi:hypothetical protein
MKKKLLEEAIMKNKLRSRKAAGCVVVAIALLLIPQTASAIFGFGDIVFDPTSWASLAEISSSNVSMLTKMTEEYAQLTKIYSNGTQIYGQAMAMSQRFTNKGMWMTSGMSMANQQVQSRYGETVNWASVMNGNPSGALAAYRNATLSLGDTSYISAGGAPGSSAHLANLASVEISDGSSTNCMNVIAQYRALQQANAQAVNNLQASQGDESDDTNSEIEQLNLINAAEAQKMMEMQSQGAVHTCLAEQQVVANTYQRNLQVESLNTNNHSIDLATNSPSGLTNVANTLNSYMPK